MATNTFTQFFKLLFERPLNIQEFLSLPEESVILNNADTKRHKLSMNGLSNTPLIVCNQLTAKWPIKEGNQRDTLMKLTFSVQRGQSIGIVGTVGSGKV